MENTLMTTQEMAPHDVITKEMLRPFLNYTLGDCCIPEIMNKSKRGKVRDVYFTKDNVVMVATDRVSAFDFVLPSLIPFKGQVLNLITQWAFQQTADIVPNGLLCSLASPQTTKARGPEELIDPAVIVQKKVRVLPVEFIVRGYLWGSLAAAYEKHVTSGKDQTGNFIFCGIEFPPGMYRYQKFSTPYFTPTTKAEHGAHDENITYSEMVALLGGDKALADQCQKLSLALFKRGQQLAEEKGLLLIDTKYEFGLDETTNKLVVVDEVNTPDSSRMVDKKEWESKWAKIEAALLSSNRSFATTSQLTSQNPELKIIEMSKQYVRDLLLEQGFDPSKQKAAPRLTDDQILECSLRYIQVYQRLTGRVFPLPTPTVGRLLPCARRLCTNLQSAGIIRGCCVPLFAGSDSDLPHLEKLQAALARYNVPSHIRICSAHKQPAQLESIIEKYNASITPLVFIGCAGGTDALSGTLSFHSRFPVVSCPPDGRNESCLSNPPGSSNVYCLRPDNAARFAAQTFALFDDTIRETLDAEIQGKVQKLQKADSTLFAPLL